MAVLATLLGLAAVGRWSAGPVSSVPAPPKPRAVEVAPTAERVLIQVGDVDISYGLLPGFPGPYEAPAPVRWASDLGVGLVDRRLVGPMRRLGLEPADIGAAGFGISPWTDFWTLRSQLYWELQLPEDHPQRTRAAQTYERLADDVLATWPQLEREIADLDALVRLADGDERFAREQLERLVAGEPIGRQVAYVSARVLDDAPYHPGLEAMAERWPEDAGPIALVGLEAAIRDGDAERGAAWYHRLVAAPPHPDTRAHLENARWQAVTRGMIPPETWEDAMAAALTACAPPPRPEPYHHGLSARHDGERWLWTPHGEVAIADCLSGRALPPPDRPVVVTAVIEVPGAR